MEYKIVRHKGFFVGRIYKNANNDINAIDYVNDELLAKRFNIRSVWYEETELNELLDYFDNLNDGEAEVFILEYNIRRYGE